MARRNELKDRYRQVTERIGEAAERSGRTAKDVYCIAVTKLASPAQVRQLMEMGHQDFGENRVQQLQQRAAIAEEVQSRQQLMGPGRGGAISETIRWHMIGHLQRNKVKPVLGLAKLIHSVDSMRLAEEIESQASRLDHEVEVLLQVKISNEPNKTGLAPASVPHMVEQMLSMTHVKVRGLMAIGELVESAEEMRPHFQRMSELFTDMKGLGRFGSGFNLLSMGMSNDYEVAVECGANLVRIGRAIFGEEADTVAA